MFINLTINERAELLSNTLIKIFSNYIPNKKVNFKYGEAPWINQNIKSILRRRSRLTKRHFVSSQVENDHSLLLSHSKKCRKMILSAKNNYMLGMSKKLNNHQMHKILLLYFQLVSQ